MRVTAMWQAGTLGYVLFPHLHAATWHLIAADIAMGTIYFLDFKGHGLDCRDAFIRSCNLVQNFIKYDCGITIDFSQHVYLSGANGQIPLQTTFESCGVHTLSCIQGLLCGMSILRGDGVHALVEGYTEADIPAIRSHFHRIVRAYAVLSDSPA